LKNSLALLNGVNYIAIKENETGQDNKPINAASQISQQAEIMTIQIVDTASVFQKAPKPEALEKLYTYRRPMEVKGYIKAHSFLVPLLVEAYDKIGEYFGSNPAVVLEVVTDPEADDYRELFAFIQISLSPEEALSRLDQLDKEWWLDASDKAQNHFCIDVEFV